MAQQTFYQPSKGGWFCLNYLLCLNSRFNCRLTTIFINFYVFTWFARVAHSYMVCVHARVAWLHGLRDGQRLLQGAQTCRYLSRSCENECCAIPRMAGSASYNVV